MKRPIIASLLLSVALALPGCPIYDDQGCTIDSQCAPGYQCQLTTGDCVAPDDQLPGQECYSPSDCPNGTCDRTGSCRSVDCSWDDVGCVAGYVCTRESGVWRCEADASSGGSSSGGDAGSAGAGVAGASAGGVSQGGASSGGASGAAGGTSEGGSAGQSSGGQSGGGQGGASGQGAGGV